MRKWLFALFVLIVATALVAAPASAVTRSHDTVDSGDRVPRRGAPEIAVPPYSLYNYYSTFAATLSRIDRLSDRITVVSTGKSANGNAMWQVICTWPMSEKLWQTNMLYRQMLLDDPGYVLDKHWLRDGSGIRPAVWLNCSIHGGETTGADAGLLLIERLAFAKDAETIGWLKNLIIVIDPVQNPDGRITDLRPNGNGFDCNRDFIQASQPEVRQTIAGIKKWLPLTMFDMHGYMNPMLVEPTTMPHCPSLEYDLYIKWALPQARFERATMQDNTGLTAQIPYLWGTAEDEFNLANESWDDYTPFYAPMFPQQYMAIGQTCETPYKTDDGVMGHYYMCVGLLSFDMAHKWAMAKDQATGFMRGDKGLLDGRPWTGNMADMIRSADPATGEIVDVGFGRPGFPYSNVVGDVTFPYAYIIPVDAAHQHNALEAYKAVNNCLFFGLEVQRAKATFAYGGTTYPAGTFVVMLQQPLRSLVNNLFWEGEDVKAVYGVSSMYDVSIWAYPRLWGFDRVKADTPFSASLHRVTGDKVARTGAVTGGGPVYMFSGTSNWSVKAVNAMTKRGFEVGMVSRTIASPHDTIPLGTYVVNCTKPYMKTYVKSLAKAWGLDFTTVAGLDMAQVASFPRCTSPRVAVNVDAQSLWVLKKYLGFDNASSTSTPGSASAFINSSTGVTAETVTTWLAGDNGSVRRTYIGIKGTSGSDGGANAALVPGIVNGNDPDPFGANNGMCAVSWNSTLGAGGWPTHDWVFVYPVGWYDVSGVFGDIVTDGVWEDGGMGAGCYQSGYWTDPTNAQPAVGMAAMVTYTPAAHGRVVFMGFHPTYRGQPENTFALVARAILESVATPPSMP